MTRAPCVSSKLNPDSDGVRSFRPLESHRKTKNAVFLKALDNNYALHEAAKADEAARAQNEQYLLAPPEDYDIIFAKYINCDAVTDDLAEHRTKAYTWYDMDNDEYY